MASFTENNDKRLSVIEQYSDALYSDFVEAKDNEKMFTEYHHHTFFQVMKPIVTDISAANGYRVLDLGCGNGILGRRINSMNENISVVGVDLSSAMLKKARQFSMPADKFHYIEGNVLHLPPNIGNFNAIVSGYMFAHLETKFDVFQVFRNIAAHLVPGGVTCNLVPGSPAGLKEGEVVPIELPAPTGSVKLYDTFWSLDTYMAAAAAAGLVEVTLRPCEMSRAGKEAELDASMFSSFVVFARKPVL